MAAPVQHGVSGWNTLFDYAIGADSGAGRVRVTMGPAKTIDTQRTALLAAYAVQTLDVSASAGSAVATIRITYGVAGTLPLGERRWPVYSVFPNMCMIDLKAHPELATIGAEMPKIDRLIAEGRIDDISTIYAADALSLKYARLVLAGTTSYEAPAFSLAVTRYYTSAPSLSTDYATINQVFAWGSISTDGKAIPATIDEPKYINPTGSATGYEWRLVSIAPVVQRGEVNTVQWQFLGLERWSKWLYSGGTWEPASL